jgi:CRISPR system Cascade subunit CasD
MPRVLLLRLDAPLMAFGGAAVDQYGVTRDFPSASMLTGLLGNALGFSHREGERLNALQDRLHFAARCDRQGEHVRDYQTVDLGQPHLLAKRVAWTTRGKLEDRKGGEASEGTHIRFRDYLADAIYTLALTLVPPDESPTLEEIATALVEPARPLFLGRKPCVPSDRLLLGRESVERAGVLGALQALPRLVSERLRTGTTEPVRAWWPDDEPLPDGVDPTHCRRVAIYDRRDWVNQIHSGRRFIKEGFIDPPFAGGTYA